MIELSSTIGGLFVAIAFVYLLLRILKLSRRRKGSLRHSTKLTTIGVVSIATIWLLGSWISERYPLLWYKDRVLIQTVKPDAKLENIEWKGRTLAYAHLSRSNLRNADLSLADLQAADLSEADLSGTILKGTHLEQANLEHANLANADLRGAKFVQANLRQANLQGADLTAADLSFSILEGADLRGTTLKNAKLIGADLRFVRNLNPEQLKLAVTDQDTLLRDSDENCVVASIKSLGWLGDRKSDFCHTLGFDKSVSSPDSPYSEGGYCVKGPAETCEERIKALESFK